MLIPRTHHVLAAALAMWSSPSLAGDTARWVMTFPSPTNNATEFERRYGGVAFTNSDVGNCSTCTNRLFSTRDTSGTFARWEFSDSTRINDNYNDHVGILLPLDPNWSWNHDIRKATRIRIKVRSIGDHYFFLGLEGPAAPFASIGLQPEHAFTAYSTWRWISLDFIDFGESGNVARNILGKTVTVSVADSIGRILTTTARVTRDPSMAYNDTSWSVLDYDNDSINILKHVRALKIIPSGGPTAAKSRLDIDSIVIDGIPRQWGNYRQSSACQGDSVVVDQYSPPQELHVANLLGGKWERTTDNSSIDPNGISTGSSSVGPQSVEEWPPRFVAQMDATLNRLDPESRPLAGWARLSSWLAADRSPVGIPGLQAISFRIQGGNSNGWFDSTRIHGVTFRLHSAITPDSVAYAVTIPYDSIRPVPGDTGRTVCIQTDALRQPSWFTGKAGIHPIDPSSLTTLSWTLSLDEASAIRANASRITIWDTKLWTSRTASRKPSRPAPGLSAQAVRGALVVAGERGRNLHVTIREASGRLVSERSAWATGNEQILSLPRSEGILLVSVTDGISRTHLKILPR